jgi:hypothetical protein
MALTAALAAFAPQCLLAADRQPGGDSPKSKKSRKHPDFEIPRLKGWPEWKFPLLIGPVFGDLLKTAEIMPFRGNPELSMDSWARLYLAHVRIFGKSDPRAWGAMSRSIRMGVTLNITKGVPEGIKLVLEGFDSSKWRACRGESRNDVLRRIGQERDFALETLAIAGRAARKGDWRALLRGFPETFPAPAGGWEIVLDADSDGTYLGRNGFDWDAEREKGTGAATGADCPPSPDNEDKARAARAEKLRSAVFSLESTLGPAHPSALNAKTLLAEHLAGRNGSARGLRDPQASEEDLQEALRLCRELQDSLKGGSRAPGEALLEVRRILALALEGSGEAGAAAEIRKKALSDAERSPGRSHALSFRLIRDHASSLAESDRKKAIRLHCEALTGLQKLLGENSREALRSLLMAADLMIEDEVQHVGILMRLDAAEILDGNGGTDLLDAVEVRAETGEMLMEMGEDDAGVLLLARAVCDSHRLTGPLSPGTIDLQHNLSLSLTELRDFTGAADVARRAAAEIEAAAAGRPRPDSNFASIMHALGMALEKGGDRAGARGAFARALEEADAGDPGGPEALEILSQTAESAEWAGDAELALELHRRLFDCRMKALGPKDPETLESRKAVKRLSGS